LKSRGISDVLVVAQHEFQKERALQLGASRAVLAESNTAKAVADFTRNRGADQVYECVGGDADTLSLAVEICAVGGRIILVGCPTRPANLDIQTLLFKEAALLPSNSYALFQGVSEFAAALDLLESGRVNHKAIITESYAPQDYDRALEAMIDKRKGKTIKPVFERT
ncbi:MAG: zinc-binding dehydrogenase, partial [Synergistaceae bacterium]|nr:zinc-binding dehydrogenase [Synergistaceae bacterium]